MKYSVVLEADWEDCFTVVVRKSRRLSRDLNDGKEAEVMISPPVRKNKCSSPKAGTRLMNWKTTWQVFMKSQAVSPPDPIRVLPTFVAVRNCFAGIMGSQWRTSKWVVT